MEIVKGTIINGREIFNPDQEKINEMIEAINKLQQIVYEYTGTINP